MRKKWESPIPKKDDFNRPVTDTFIDGKTHYGSWAIMTPVSWRQHGIGRLGLGRGQAYQRDQDGNFYKMEGEA
jgi:hypothetical protein